MSPVSVFLAARFDNVCMFLAACCSFHCLSAAHSICAITCLYNPPSMLLCLSLCCPLLVLSPVSMSPPPPCCFSPVSPPLIGAIFCLCVPPACCAPQPLIGAISCLYVPPACCCCSCVSGASHWRCLMSVYSPSMLLLSLCCPLYLCCLLSLFYLQPACFYIRDQ